MDRIPITVSFDAYAPDEVARRVEEVGLGVCAEIAIGNGDCSRRSAFSQTLRLTSIYWASMNGEASDVLSFFRTHALETSRRPLQYFE